MYTPSVDYNISKHTNYSHINRNLLDLVINYISIEFIINAISKINSNKEDKVDIENFSEKHINYNGHIDSVGIYVNTNLSSIFIHKSVLVKYIIDRLKESNIGVYIYNIYFSELERYKKG